MNLDRRRFLGLLAAPAIVKASSLMAISPVRPIDYTVSYSSASPEADGSLIAGLSGLTIEDIMRARDALRANDIRPDENGYYHLVGLGQHRLVGAENFEISTYRLRAGRSASELYPREIGMPGRV